MDAKQQEQDDKVLVAVKRLLTEARSKGVSGQGCVKLEFHQGGVTKKEMTLTWIDRS